MNVCVCVSFLVNMKLAFVNKIDEFAVLKYMRSNAPS